MYSVLIADDNKKICDGLMIIMQQCFPNLPILGPYYSGEDALAAIEKTMPDIVISDIQMPRVDGLEICRFIRSHSSSTKIILVTGYQEFEYAKKAIDYNVSALLVKPYSSDQLIELVKGVIRELDQQIQNAHDSTYTYLAKWEETRRRIAALLYGNADSGFSDIKLLCYSTFINECKVSELTLSNTNSATDSALEFDSPNLSVFCIKNKLVMFFKNSAFRDSYISDCSQTDLFKSDSLGGIPEMNFSEWYSSVFINTIAEEMANSFKESSVDSFISGKRYALENIKDLSVLFDKTAAILGYTVTRPVLSENDSYEKSILRFFNSYLSSASVLSSKIKLFIEDNYRDPNLSVNDIAEHFMLTSNYIGEYFKLQTGLSVREYINEIRIKAAKNYLATNPNATNEDIAEATGYNSPSYFHRIFKKLVHMTPAQFRKTERSLKNEKSEL